MPNSQQSILDLLPTEVLSSIVQAAALSDREYITPDGTSTAWQLGPTEHALVALSQTCRTLRSIAAPYLWKHIATRTNSRLVEDSADLLPKLIICLQDPVARDALESINFNASNYGYSQLRDNPLFFQGTTITPDYFAYLRSMDELGATLVGTNLSQLRFLPFDLGPSDAFLKAVGKGCKHLTHLHLSYGSDTMPTEQVDDETVFNGPDPLHWLHRVNCTLLGMGYTEQGSDLRLLDGDAWHIEDEDKIPYVVKWLRGELPEELGNEHGDDNALVNLKTTASFLYRHRCLVPAWARFNRILERFAEPQDADSFPHGELEDEYTEPGGEWHDDEMAYIRAACALRPSLDELAQRNGGDDTSVTPEQVFDMVHSNPTFRPWRARWFRGKKATSSRPASRAYLESIRFATEILHYWRKSAPSRRRDPGPCQRWYTGWPNQD